MRLTWPEWLEVWRSPEVEPVRKLYRAAGRALSLREFLGWYLNAETIIVERAEGSS